jgi:hypothetical protein
MTISAKGVDLALGLIADLFTQKVEMAQHLRRVVGKNLARVRELNALARPHEQLRTEIAFEKCEPTRQRRLRHAKFGGGLVDAAVFAGPHEKLDLTDFHVPSSRSTCGNAPMTTSTYSRNR